MSSLIPVNATSSRRDSAPSSDVLFVGKLFEDPTTFFDFFEINGIINSNSGLLTSKYQALELPALDDNTKLAIDRFMYQKLQDGTDIFMAGMLSTVEKYCLDRGLHMEGCIVGSAVYALLKTYLPLIMQKHFQMNAKDYETFISQVNINPEDTDFRINLPNASQQELFEVANFMVAWVAHKLRCTFSDVKNQVTRNFRYIGTETSSYFILSFEFKKEGIPHKIDLSLISYSSRTHLFNDQGLVLALQPSSFRVKSVEGNVQAIVDRVGNIVRIENPQEVNHLGWFSYISLLTKGRRSLEASSFMELWKKVDQSDLTKVVEQLRKTAINHHPKQEEDAFLSLAFNACSVLSQNEDQEFINRLPFFLSEIHRRIDPSKLQDPLLKLIWEGLGRKIPFNILKEMTCVNALFTFGPNTRAVKVDKVPAVLLRGNSSCVLHLKPTKNNGIIRSVLAYCQSLNVDEQKDFSRNCLDFLGKLYRLSSVFLQNKETSKDIDSIYANCSLEMDQLPGNAPSFLHPLLFQLYLYDYARAPSVNKLSVILKTFYSLLETFADEKDLTASLLAWLQKALEEGGRKKKSNLVGTIKELQLLPDDYSQNQTNFVRALIKCNDNHARILSGELCKQLPLGKIVEVFPAFLKRDFRLGLDILAFCNRKAPASESHSLLSLFQMGISHVMRELPESVNLTPPVMTGIDHLAATLKRLRTDDPKRLSEVDPHALVWLSEKRNQVEVWASVQVMHEQRFITPDKARVLVPHWMSVAQDSLKEKDLDTAETVFRMWYVERETITWPCHPNCDLSIEEKRIFLDLLFALFEKGRCPELFKEFPNKHELLYLVTSLSYPTNPERLAFLASAYEAEVLGILIGDDWKERYKRMKTSSTGQTALELEIAYLFRCLNEKIYTEASKLPASLAKIPEQERGVYLRRAIPILFKNPSKNHLDIAEKFVVRFLPELDEVAIGSLWEEVKLGIGKKEYYPIFNLLLPRLFANPTHLLAVVETFIEGHISASRVRETLSSSSLNEEGQEVVREILEKLLTDTKREPFAVAEMIIQKFQNDFDEETLEILAESFKKGIVVKKEGVAALFSMFLPRFVSTPSLYVKTITTFSEKEVSSQSSKVKESLNTNAILIEPLQRMQEQRIPRIKEVLKVFFSEFSSDRGALTEKIISHFGSEFDRELLEMLFNCLLTAMKEKKIDKAYYSILTLMLPHFLSEPTLFRRTLEEFSHKDFSQVGKVQENLSSAYDRLPMTVRRNPEIIEQAELVMQALTQDLSKERFDLVERLVKDRETFTVSLLTFFLSECKIQTKENKYKLFLFALLLPRLLSCSDTFVASAIFLTDKDVVSHPKAREQTPEARIVASLQEMETARPSLIKELIQEFWKAPTKERQEIILKLIELFGNDFDEDFLKLFLERATLEVSEKKNAKTAFFPCSLLFSRFIESSALRLPFLRTTFQVLQSPNSELVKVVRENQRVITDRLTETGDLEIAIEFLEIGVFRLEADEIVFNESQIRQLFVIAKQKNYHSLACALFIRMSPVDSLNEAEKIEFAQTLLSNDRVLYIETVLAILKSVEDVKKYQKFAEDYCRTLFALAKRSNSEIDLKEKAVLERLEVSLPTHAAFLMQRFSVHSRDLLFTLIEWMLRSESYQLRNAYYPMIRGSEENLADPSSDKSDEEYLMVLDLFIEENELSIIQNWLSHESFIDKIKGSKGLEVFLSVVKYLKGKSCSEDQYRRLQEVRSLLPKEVHEAAESKLLALGISQPSLRTAALEELNGRFSIEVNEMRISESLIPVVLNYIQEDEIRANWKNWKDAYANVVRGVLASQVVEKNNWTEMLAIYRTHFQFNPGWFSDHDVLIHGMFSLWVSAKSVAQSSHPYFLQTVAAMLDARSIQNYPVLQNIVLSFPMSSAERGRLLSKYCEAVDNHLKKYASEKDETTFFQEDTFGLPVFWDDLIESAFLVASRIENKEARLKATKAILDQQLNQFLNPNFGPPNEGGYFWILQHTVRELSHLLGKEIDCEKFNPDFPPSVKAITSPLVLDPARKNEALFYSCATHVIERLVDVNLPIHASQSAYNTFLLVLLADLIKNFSTKPNELGPLCKRVFYNKYSVKKDSGMRAFAYGLDQLTEIISKFRGASNVWKDLDLKAGFLTRICWLVKVGNNQRQTMTVEHFNQFHSIYHGILNDLLKTGVIEHLHLVCAFLGTVTTVHHAEGKKVPEHFVDFSREVILKIVEVDYFSYCIEGFNDRTTYQLAVGLVRAFLCSIAATPQVMHRNTVLMLNQASKIINDTIKTDTKPEISAERKKEMVTLLQQWTQSILLLGATYLDINTFSQHFFPCANGLIGYFEAHCIRNWDLRVLRTLKQISNLAYQFEVNNFDANQLTPNNKTEYERLGIRMQVCLRRYVAAHPEKLVYTNLYPLGPEKDKKFPPVEVILTSQERVAFAKMFAPNEKINPYFQYKNPILNYQGPIILYNVVTARIGPDQHFPPLS